MLEKGVVVLDGETMLEQWKDIHGFESVYQISTHGRVRRLVQISPKILRCVTMTATKPIIV